MKILKKYIFVKLFFIIIFFGFSSKITAQVSFPAVNFWSLDAGLGINDMVVSGKALNFIIEPKLWLSTPLMVGAKFGINYSWENDNRNILSLDTQVFLRWIFFYFGKPANPIPIFIQGGIGIIAAYRGNANNPQDLFSDVTMTRGSVLGEIATGITIPLTERWHIEPVLRAGYPHLWGISVTAGYKFPLSWNKTVRQASESYYNEVVKTLPPNEIVKRIMVSSVEYVIFAGDVGRYNVMIDRDAQALNELVLNSIAQFLKENPDCVVRIDGHANPVTQDPREREELLVLSRQRTNAVAEQLRVRGISDSQMVLVFHGGERTVIPLSDTEHWNRNRRVELLLIQIDNTETN